METPTNWLQGARTGFRKSLVIIAVPALLAVSEVLFNLSEGYEAAGFMLILAGLPTTLIESLLERYDLCMSTQLTNLFMFTIINWVLIGSLSGMIGGRSKSMKSNQAL